MHFPFKIKLQNCELCKEPLSEGLWSRSYIYIYVYIYIYIYIGVRGGHAHGKCAASFAGIEHSGLQISPPPAPPAPPRSGLGWAGLGWAGRFSTNAV